MDCCGRVSHPTLVEHLWASCHIAIFCKRQHPVHVSFVQTAYSPKNPFVHALDNFSCMGFAQVGLSFDHLEGLMPENLGDFSDACAIHG